MTARLKTPTTFAATAQRLTDNGYDALPICKVHGKRPDPEVGNWRKYRLSAGDVEHYATNGTGVRCGEAIGVDIDVREAELVERIESLADDMLEKNAPRRIGADPKVLRMYRTEKPFKKITGKRWVLPGDDDKAPHYKAHKVEVLADGEQFVAFGIHKDTHRPYRWNGAGDPLSVALEDLPLITEAQARAFVEAADALLAKVGTRHKTIALDFAPQLASRHKPQLVATNQVELFSALASIPNTLAYEDWIKVGLAFREACGAHADTDALEAWVTWSLKWPANSRKVAVDKWSSFKSKPGRERAGAGTIFELAKRAGWRPAWSQPIDFLHEIAAPAFTGEDVPAIIGDYAMAWARAAGFDPTAFIAAGVTTVATALSDSIQLDVQRSTTWRESARLWSAVIAQPGQAKTPMIKAAVLPLQMIHQRLVEAYAVTADDDDPEPKPATFTSDSTIEALSKILADNPRGVMYLAHELDSWIGSHDAYRNGGGSPDRGQWMELFDGGPHQVDRIKRGSFYVPNWGVSLMSATTPSALMKLRNKLPNDGLLQRVLVFFSKEPSPPQPDWPTQRECARYEQLIRTVYEFHDHLPLVELSGEAREAFKRESDRYRMLAPACASISEGFAGHVSKYGAMLARVTLTFHATVCAGRKVHPAKMPVTLDTVETAKRFMSKCFLHSRALYDMLSGADSAMQLARDVGAALVADKYELTTRRVLVQRIKAFRDAEPHLQQAAMQLLCDFDWCRIEDGKYEKGYPTTWAVNPRVHIQFVEYGERLKQRRAFVKEAILSAHADRQA